jgi:cation/acetate symporter
MSMTSLEKLTLSVAALCSSSAAIAGTSAVADEFKWMTFTVFGVIIAITMAITFWAARSTHSTTEFYAAGRSVSGIQNGWAIAGDYLFRDRGSDLAVRI